MKKWIPRFFFLLSRLLPVKTAQVAASLVLKPRRLPRADIEMKFWSEGTPIELCSGRALRSWGEGPVIWLIHGWESRGATFYKLVPELVKQGFKTLVWDGPAHGDSPGERTHVPYQAQCLAEDMKQIHGDEPPYALIGHSFGGASFALLADMIRLPARLVIIAAPTRIDLVFSRMAQLLRLGQRSTQAFFKALETETSFSMSDASLVNQDLSINSAVLVLHDQEDKEVPFADFQILKKEWQAGQFVATRGLGHKNIKQDKAVFKEIMGFLRAET
ncbi:alpha/beta fold hydrolase [Marinicella sp. W31]|uniref:alpha/beta fold hydrolase n=1 Tax=Marinicella sp. W31 TaxID=3023713 RepID=UPI003757851D